MSAHCVILREAARALVVPCVRHGDRIIDNLLFAAEPWLLRAGRLGEWTTQQPVRITHREDR